MCYQGWIRNKDVVSLLSDMGLEMAKLSGILLVLPFLYIETIEKQVN